MYGHPLSPLCELPDDVGRRFNLIGVTSIADWNNFSETYADQWPTFYVQWMKFKGPLLLINFDDLVHSLDTQVKKVR